MKKIYVVGTIAMEYNDSTYDYAEGITIDNNAYLDLEEAKAVAKVQLRNFFKSYLRIKELSDWSEDPSDYGFSHWKAYHADGGEPNDNVSEYIEWCEKNNLEWANAVPQMVTVQELTFEDK